MGPSLNPEPQTLGHTLAYWTSCWWASGLSRAMCSVSVVPGLAMQPLVFRGSLPTAVFCTARSQHQTGWHRLSASRV